MIESISNRTDQLQVAESPNDEIFLISEKNPQIDKYDEK